MFTKLRNSNLADLSLSRKGYSLSHMFSALLVWAIAIATTGNKFFLLVTDSLLHSFERFDGAKNTVDLFVLDASGSSAAVRVVNSLLGSLSMIFVPMLPRNAAGVPVTPPQFSKFQNELHYVTPEPKIIVAWFATALLTIVFMFLVMDYVYEFLGVLVMYVSTTGFAHAFSIFMGIVLVLVWTVALYARLRDTDTLDPNWTFFVIAFIGYFIYTASIGNSGSIVHNIITVLGLLVSSYIGFSAMFMQSDLNASIARKVRRKDRRYLKLARKGKV